MKRGAVRQYKDPTRLTPQEEAVWSLYSQGKSAPEIADALGLARHGSTVSTIIRRAKEKVKAKAGEAYE